MTEKELFDMIEVAAHTLQEACGDAFDVDDVRWGNDRFAMSVVSVEDKMLEGPMWEFYFRYDSDDELSAEEQLKEKLDEFILVHF